LGDDQNFSVGHTIEKFGEGEVIRENTRDAAWFGYSSPVYFFETRDKRRFNNLQATHLGAIFCGKRA